MLPAPASAQAAAAGSAALRVPGGLLVELLEARDELLDPVVVREDLGGRRQLASEEPVEDRIEEQHGVRAERSVRPAGLQEVDRRRRQAAELDLAGDLFDELVALVVGGLERHAHRWGVRIMVR